MTKLVFLAIIMLFARTMPAWADDDHYRPTVSGKPAGTVVGTLVDYGEGMASGAVTVRTAGGNVVEFYTAKSPFTIDGRKIACPNPPRPPAYRRDPEVCFHWPSCVKIGITRVSVPYWKGVRYGEATRIARGLTVLKRRGEDR